MPPPVTPAEDLCAVGRHQWVVACQASNIPCFREYEEFQCALLYCGWCETFKHIHFPLNWPDMPV